MGIDLALIKRHIAPQPLDLFEGLGSVAVENADIGLLDPIIGA